MVNMAPNLNKNGSLNDNCTIIVSNQVKNNFGWDVDKIILAATVYFICQERNWRLFKDESRSMEVVVKSIKDCVKSKLRMLLIQSDSHEHLFFQCPFANKIWVDMVNMAPNLNKNGSLNDNCTIIVSNQVKNNFGWAVDKIILAATVYFICQERNWRLFKDESRSMEVVVKSIKDCVKSKLLSSKVKKSMKAQLLADNWGLIWTSNGNFIAC
ncbi:RNA-directed DNA polymerase, eukaryota, Reverse transcriptase zinc-binding domain protein [Artemisia annua]|uniref:RNA-directed DNA polymerase, eukaryota, Reverse transcriptase zinc-binding domain protein n=1 Tax=Artemisia annua TaxID=35608 RepID=A0A2U1MAC8_ARTAN|nr:RNA-directed DNA polymerase, eukaryota, Reverse transcriptase zinc-binding domain protein [Artemisia annua]